MPELTERLYQIVSVLHDNRAASINGLIPLPTQFVRLGLDARVWEITRKGEDLYHFAIKDRYPSTGVEDEKVIATIDIEKNVLWHVTPRSSGSKEGYTIEPDYDHEKAWTVASESDPDSEIVIDNIRYLPPDIHPPFVSPTQLFQIIPANY